MKAEATETEPCLVLRLGGEGRLITERAGHELLLRERSGGTLPGDYGTHTHSLLVIILDAFNCANRCAYLGKDCGNSSFLRHTCEWSAHIQAHTHKDTGYPNK